MRLTPPRFLVGLSLSAFVAVVATQGCSSSDKSNGTGGTGGAATGGAAGSRGGAGGDAATGGAAGTAAGGAGAVGGAGGKAVGGEAGGSAGTAGGGAAGGAGGAPSMLSLTFMSLGTSTAAGTAVFEKVTGNQIKLTVNVTQVMPVSVQHGIHIHANGDCGSTSDGDGGTTPGGAAGGHWNPMTHDHGGSVSTNHLGDIGNITIDGSGVGSLTFMTDQWTMGTGASNDILNHALVLHAGMDDGVTQPTGNSGGRIACVIIR